MWKQWIPIAAIPFLLVTIQEAAAAPCDSVIRDRLAAVGVNMEDVRRIDVRARTDSGETTRFLVGWEAWVRLRSCKGAVIVDMTSSCYVQQVYTRDGCQVSGLTNWC